MSNEMLTITLTGHAPVRVTKADWKLVAASEIGRGDGEVPAQMTRQTKAWLRVRRHADDRAIVYGCYDHKSQWRGEESRGVRVGELLPPGADLPAVIARLGDDLTAARSDSDMLDPHAIDDLVRNCIADLPAEVL